MKDNETKLSDDDRVRMARLYEEIQGRLHEMGLIAARALQRSADRVGGAELGIAIAEAQRKGARQAEYEGVRWIYKDGKCVGIYNYDTGVCYPC